MVKDSFPLVRWRRIGGDPPPISNKGRYVRRVVRLVLADGESVTIGSLSSALGHSGDFVVTNVRLWGALSGSAVSTATFMAYPGNLLAGAGTSASPLEVTDEGTFSSRAAVEFTIPRAHAVNTVYNTGSTAKIVSIIGSSGFAYVTCMQFAA